MIDKKTTGGNGGTTIHTGNAESTSVSKLPFAAFYEEIIDRIDALSDNQGAALAQIDTQSEKIDNLADITSRSGKAEFTVEKMATPPGRLDVYLSAAGVIIAIVAILISYIDAKVESIDAKFETYDTKLESTLISIESVAKDMNRNMQIHQKTIEAMQSEISHQQEINDLKLELIEQKVQKNQ